MIGQTISHYRIEEQLGQGGMGIVYRAVDTKLKRDVALKFLPPQLSADQDAKARFMQEAQAASRLDHPNICTIHEIGEVPHVGSSEIPGASAEEIGETKDGRLFIAMAYYDGQTLKYLMDEGALPVDQAASIAAQIMEGLERSHEAGIIHRDIKPANIMVTKRGRVKILDFGVAKLGAGADLTKAGSTVGTTAYMSPEQARGDSIDARTDLWSVGVLFYEMLSGRKPFGGEYEQAVLYAVLNETPGPLDHSVPEEIRQISDKLLAKDVNERYGSATEALVDLAPHSGTQTRTVADISTETPPPALISNRMAAVAGGVLVLAVLAWIFFRPQTENVPDTPILREGIAVLPFTIRGDTTLNYMSEAIVSLLSTKIDGVGDLRSIDDHALLGYIKRSGAQIIDPESGQDIANYFGAAGFILGDIQRIGGPILISASRYSADGSLEQEFEVNVRADSLLLDAVDELARNLISEHLADAGTQLESMAAVASASFPALREHLNGEVAMRNGRWTDAYSSFKRATDIDSTFALAWFRLANAAGWGTNPRAEVLPAFRRAARHGENLPERMKKKIAGAIAFETGKPAFAEQLYQELVRDYPDDAYAWYRLAETRFHYNYSRGRPPSDALGAFIRAFELDPSQSEIAYHLYELDLEEGRFERFDALAEALGSDDDVVLSSLRPIMPQLATDSLELRNELIGELADSSVSILTSAASSVAEFFEDFELADSLITIAIEKSPREQKEGRYRARSRYRLAMGRHRDAWLDKTRADSVGAISSIFDIQYVYTTRIPIPDEGMDRVRAEFRAFSDSSLFRGPYALQFIPYMLFLEATVAVQQRDENFVQDAVGYYERRVSAFPQDTLAYSLARRLEAQMAFRDGDYEKTLDRLDESRLNIVWQWAAPVLNQIPENTMRAEALYALGRTDEALGWLEAIGDGLSNTMVDAGYLFQDVAQSYLMQAKIHEERGNYEKAIRFYTRFIKTWKNADPEFQPAVEDARDRLDRLVLLQAREPG
ncbi:MAG: hypothetical protein BMS9Abin05_1034 [Rhodothermia bacterium]|nr:MAG: hypothetical protein BMS9Abin05_1034 [Rhodothermia bacterium]